MAGSTTDRRGLYILALGLCVATAAHYASMDFLGPLLADDGELSPQYETILRVIIACLAILAAFAALGWFNLGLRLKLILFAVPLLFFFTLALYKRRYGIDDHVYLRLAEEDSIAEWASFFALFAAFIVGSYVTIGYVRARRPLHSTYFALVSLFCLFVALEEISYGQRVFSIETPKAISAINAQNEINVHNIRATSHFAYVIAPRLVLTYCLAGFMVFKVLVRAFPSLVSVKEFIFPWYCSSYFAPLAVYRALEINGYPVDSCCAQGQFLIWQDQEPAEMFFAFGLLIFMCGSLRSYRPGHHSTPRPR